MLRQFALVLLGTSVAVVMATFAALCVYACPVLDDYTIDQMVRDEGILGAQVHWYTQWHGKFSGMLAMSAFPWLFDLVRDYPLAPAFVLVGTLSAIAAFVRVAVPGRGFAGSLGTAAVLLAVFAANVPSPVEAIYWMTGAYAYQFGVISAIALLALLACRPSGRGGRFANTFAAALAGLSVAGSAETVMLPAATLAFGYCVRCLFRREEATSRGLVVAAVILASGAAMVLAPGNAIRGAFFDEHSHDLIRSVSRSFERAGKYLLVFGANASLVGAGLLFAPACRSAADRLLRLPHLVRVVLFVVLLAVAFFPAYWATGYLPPPRAMSAIWCMFAIGWFVALVPAVGAALRARGLVWPAERRQLVGAVVLAVGLLVQGNARPALGDLFGGEAPAYRAQNVDRHARLSEAAQNGPGSIAIPPITAHPEMLFMGDISADPGDWGNLSIARYYGLTSVTLEIAEPR